MENSEFIPYEETQDVIVLGFKELCNAIIYPDNEVVVGNPDFVRIMQRKDKSILPCPSFHQIFRWFRQKHNLDSYLKPEIINKIKIYDYYIWIDNNEDLEIGMTNFSPYNQVELECLRKLIEIVKNK